MTEVTLQCEYSKSLAHHFLMDIENYATSVIFLFCFGSQEIQSQIWEHIL